MKNIFIKMKNNILVSTIIIDLIIILIGLINYFVFKVMFRQWVYYFLIVVNIIAFIVGIIQKIRSKNKIVKITFISIGILLIILIIIFWKLILLVFAFSYSPEHVIQKDDKKYVAYVKAFLHVDVYYYDYINFFLCGNQLRLHEDYGKGGYDPFDGNHPNSKPIENNDNIIDKQNENYEDNNTNEIKQENDNLNSNIQDILYEKVINEKVSIRVKYKGAILAQRSIIGIEKTIDGGKTWNEQLESADGFIQIHNGAKFTFIDENIGFINDPGLARNRWRK